MYLKIKLSFIHPKLNSSSSFILPLQFLNSNSLVHGFLNLSLELNTDQKTAYKTTALLHLMQICVTFIYYLFIIFIFGCVGSSFLCEGFLQLRRVGATLPCGARASHYRGLSCCEAEAPDAQAQQLWLTGPVAPRHVGSSQTRARTRVPCLGRRILNHCATREAPCVTFIPNLFKRYNSLASILTLLSL